MQCCYYLQKCCAKDVIRILLALFYERICDTSTVSGTKNVLQPLQSHRCDLLKVMRLFGCCSCCRTTQRLYVRVQNMHHVPRWIDEITAVALTHWLCVHFSDASLLCTLMSFWIYGYSLTIECIFPISRSPLLACMSKIDH